jgi:hypothetical protein
METKGALKFVTNTNRPRLGVDIVKQGSLVKQGEERDIVCSERYSIS